MSVQAFQPGSTSPIQNEGYGLDNQRKLGAMTMEPLIQSAQIPVTQPGWGMEGFRNLQTQSPMGAVQMGQPAPTQRAQVDPSLMQQLAYMGT